ncbi:cupin domain-containing protein [Vreelandella neptunia]|uniref:Cupin domain-containing protein n=1 Tax=Vreelandella neptunia TaxID=115551 RepID=A0ABZ0YGY7_9GAMM|nr:cupin domain-containing protein [Halomonas neptunia]MDN3561830.1 cupin domain-containing protein [Halomonas neptunia]TDW00351.1 ChrR-like protein with cupin domain [Halomonas alkaliantarctica]WQH11181.1 cupin domain-containing protein [Halomonas neptunia]
MKNAKILSNLLSDQDALDNLNWQPHRRDGRANADIFELYDGRNNNNEGPKAALMRYRPGATVKPHLHPGYELIFVLKGTLINDTGEHPEGTLEVCPPGSIHSLSSPGGCIFLVVWEQPVEVLEDTHNRIEKYEKSCASDSLISQCNGKLNAEKFREIPE